MRAKGASATCLELTEGGQWLLNRLVQVEGKLDKQQMNELLRLASQFFAKRASGKVVAFMKKADPTRTLFDLELPILNGNAAVTGFTGYCDWVD